MAAARLGGRRRTEIVRNSGIALFVLCCVLSFVHPPLAMAGNPEKAGFCDGADVREIIPPLKGMRDLPTPPYGSARPILGRSGLKIFPLGLSRLSVGASKLGFYLEALAPKAIKVGWSASSRLSVVNRSGKVQQVLASDVQSIGVLKSGSTRQIGFDVNAERRLYRVDVWFHRGNNGHVHYADYFRVVSREVSIRLGVEASTYQPGQDVRFHLENRGTVEITYGYAYSLEHWNGVAWKTSMTPLPGSFQVALGLAAGQVQGCQGLELPEDMPTGRYRLGKAFSIFPKPHSPSQVARATFVVTRSPSPPPYLSLSA